MRIQSRPTRLTTSLLSGLLLSGGLCLQLISLPAEAQSSSKIQDAIINYNQGIEAYEQGRPADAIKKFQRAIQIDPAYGYAYYNLGTIYYEQKNYGDAAEMFQKAVNLTPTDGQAKYNLAMSLEKLGSTEEAVNIFSQIPSGDPKYGQAQAKLSELRLSLKPKVNTAAAAKPTPVTKPATQAAKPAANGKISTLIFSKGYDGPTGITIGPGGFMYVANYSKNLIYRVGASGEKSVFSSGEGIKGPIGLTYNPKTNELYVANYLLNNVTRISATGKASVLIGNLTKPYNLFLDTVNNALYISEQDPANVIAKVALP